MVGRVRSSRGSRVVPIVIALVLFVLGIVWFVTRSEPDAAPIASSIPEHGVAAAESAHVVAPVDAPGLAPAEREVLASESAPEPAPVETPATPPLVTTAGELAWIEIEVVDPRSEPVAAARVTIDGMRMKDEPGSWFGLEEEQTATTDESGRAKLAYPTLVHGQKDTGFLTLKVEHSDFVPYRDEMLDISSGRATIHLTTGAFLIVSGWIDSPSERITDLHPRMEDSAQLKKDDWAPMRDGRPSTGNIAPGEHLLMLIHDDPKRGRFFSAAERFTLVSGETRELNLQLFGARTLVGKLGPEVPRPIANGDVCLASDARITEGERKVLPQWFRASIAADGSFTIPNVPAGAGELIAMCDGFVSSRPEAQGLHVEYAQPDGTTLTRNRDPHIFDIAVDGSEIEIPMIATATFHGSVRDPSGQPVVGARVDFWPNVSWDFGYSQIFLDREFTGTSDATGSIVVANLPPGTRDFLLQHERWHLPLVAKWGRMEPLGSAELVSGKTTDSVLEVIAHE